jgi:glycosyltransferase involved in cell wall biosynthesis
VSENEAVISNESTALDPRERGSRLGPANSGVSPEAKSFPRVSVVVVAHDRREYLLDAVRSAISQDLSAVSVEIVVVKNFADESIDAFLGARGISHQPTTVASLAEKIAEGIRRSRGEVISVLDDDDRFAAQKLDRVAKEFASDPELGFYHNGFTYIDEAGRSVTPTSSNSLALRKSGGRRRVLLTGSRKGAASHRLANMHPDFNTSSISLSRDFAEFALPYLDQGLPAADTTLFYTALMSPFHVLVDERPLTEYRIHSRNTAPTTGTNADALLAQKRRFTERADLSYSALLMRAAEAGDPAIRANVEALLLVDRIYQCFRNPSSQRREMMAALVRLPRYGRTYVVRSNAPALLSALLFPIAPGLIRRIYAQRVTIG